MQKPNSNARRDRGGGSVEASPARSSSPATRGTKANNPNGGTFPKTMASSLASAKAI